MTGSYKQLHEIKCGQVTTPDRVKLVDSCVHGYITTVNDNAVLLFNVERYLKANSACALRKDKPLPDHTPDVSISTTDPVSWISFNNEGLVLAVITSSASRGTFVHLVYLKQILQYNTCTLADISRPVRVCGGEQLTADGNPGWELRDFSWNPSVPTLFVAVLRSGAVRLISATPNAKEPEELINQLPSTADARCLSWSTKGKQLAICITGSVSVQSGPVQGPLILQTDPGLRLKRIVLLNTVFDQLDVGSMPSPLDMLWTSPACFLLGLQSSSPTSGTLMRTVMVHAPTKSTEVNFVEVADLLIKPESSHHQYYLQAIGSGHFVAAQSAGGEQLVVFHSPSGSTTPPTPLVQIELPPAGFVLGLALGFYRPCPSSGDSSKVIAYLVSRLTNGNLAPFVLQMNELLSSVISTLPEPVELPLPPPLPTSTGAEVPQPVETHPKNELPTSSLDATHKSALNRTEGDSSFMSFSRPNPTRPDTTTPISRPQPTQVAEPFQSRHISSASQPFSVPLTTSTALKPEEPCLAQSTLSNKPVAHQTPQVLPPRDVPLPRSLQIAAAQFTAALQAEAESGRAAWRDLFGLMQNGPQPKSVNDNRSAASQPTGVDVTESKLHDTELFLNAVDEVLRELKSSISVRKEEVSAYAAYAEKVRKALHLCAAGDWMPVLSGHLDPESARLLGRLKQKTRLAESGLFDLDNQIEELFAELKRQQESPLHSSPRSTGDKKLPTKAIGPTSKLMSVVETITRLLQTERDRVEYVMEGFRRLQLINGTPMKEVSQSICSPSPQRLTPRTGQSRTKRNVTATGDESVSPVWHSLVQRDRALYQLFAKHQLSTVHAQFVCPLITDESKSAVATIDTSTDSKPVDSYKVTEGIPPSSVVSGTTLNNPQQLKLEKLVDISSKVASMNSPPSLRNLALTDSKVSESSFSRSPRTTPPSPFVVKAPPIEPITPSVVETSSETPRPVSFTPPSTTSVFASPKTENPATTSNSDSAAFLSPGSFRLGVKTAFGLSPVSSNLVPNSASVTVAATVATGLVVTQSSPQSMNPQNPVCSQEARTTEPRAANSPATTAVSFGLPTTPSLFASSTGTRSIFAQSFTATPPSTNDSAPQSTVLNTTSTLTTASTTPTAISFLSTTSTTTGKPFGQSGSSLFGTVSSVPSATPATTTVTVNPTSPKPTDLGATSLSFGTGGGANTTTTSSLPSPGLFGSITTTKPSFPQATITSTMVSTPGQFGFGVSSPTILTPAAPTTIGGAKTTTTSAPGTTPTTSTSMFGLFNAPPNLPTFGSTTTNTTSSATLFGAPATTNTSGGLFGSLKPAAAASSAATTISTGTLFGMLSAPIATTTAPTATASGGLFRTMEIKTTAASTQPSTGGLFGSVQTASSTGLFGTSTTVTSSPTAVNATTTSTAPPSTAGGLFSAIPSGLFSSTSTTNASNSGGLFGASASTPQSPNLGLFGAKSTTVSPAQPTAAAPNIPSLFGSVDATSPMASGGLFGSTTGTKEIQSLFSGSTFGLGTSSSTPQTPVQNVFGKPSATVGPSPGLFGSPSANPSGAGLFGAPAFGSNTASSPTGTSGLFGSSAPSVGGGGGGLFGSGSTMGAGGGLFGSSTTTTASAGGLFGNSAATKSTTSTGGLFSNLGATSPTTGSGGLFGSSTSGGFGSRPMFDNTKFGASAGPTAFGSGGAAPFGSEPSKGGSLFGALAAAAPNPGAGGLFAGLAAKTEGPSFGSLAMHSPTAQPTPATPFGGGPSFTQRRA